MTSSSSSIQNSSIRSKSSRVRSIDIIRALTMLLMIFVNDLWTLSDIPGFLGHKPADVDGMGLADVVFPAFLLIVGLSIPHAIRARRKKGDNELRILLHIGERTLALLIMGLFMVNKQYIGQSHMPLGAVYWGLLMIFAFFLIWNVYKGKVFGRLSPWILKGAGWGILVFLAIIYKDAEGGWMELRWWGILGLIGWAYLIGAVAYQWLGRRPLWIALLLLLMILLNVNEFHTPLEKGLRLVVSASNYSLVLCGVLVTSLMISLKEKNKMNYLPAMLLGLAALLFAFGFLSRPIWGISKIYATPSWTAICAGITILAFILIYFTADVLGRYRWAKIIAPAGTMTLTCYLIPYYVYSFRSIIGIELPPGLTTGMVGVLKSIIFAILIIQLTGLTGRLGIKLKI